MNYKFSKNIDGLKPSEIREILKLSSAPGIIPFSAGNPDAEAFPISEITKISNNLLLNEPVNALQYSITEGYQPLIQHLLDYNKIANKIGDETDNLIITSGAQQVINLTAKILCDRGDTVVCEDPSFIGSLNAFRSYGLNLVGVPVENDGIDINLLEQALKTNKNTKFIYTIPNFQNPSGVTMSLDKRKSLYNLAKKYNVIILEDNPYGDIRFMGESLPSIKSFDDEGLVIYAGSFSKVLSPGMRLGFALANKEIISKLTVVKQTDDVHTNIWSQMIAYNFLKEYDFNLHLKRIRAIYLKKATLCMNLIDKYLLPKNITYNKVEGGLFIWCRLPDNIDMKDFCLKAIKHKVAVVPGTAFAIDQNKKTNYFRINFSTPTEDQITEGIKILASILED